MRAHGSRLTLVAVAVVLAAGSGRALDEIDVSANADAKAMQRALQEISEAVFPCLMRASGDGRSDADAEAYCFCRHRSLVAARLSSLKKLGEKHPEWKGKTLKVVSGSADDRETHRFGDPQIAEIEASLEHAAKTCDEGS